MKTFYKTPLFIALLLVTFCTLSVFSAGAVSEKIFSLSDVNAVKGRLCTVELSAEGIDNIGAFLAELEYDPKMLSFRGVKAESSSAECSAYCEAEGRINLVFLQKEGIKAPNKTTLLSLEFMAEADGSSEISLLITDAIDSEGKDIENILSASAKVTVSGRSSGTSNEGQKSKQQENSDEEKNTTEHTQENSGGFLSVQGGGVSTTVLVFVALSGVLLIAVSAFIAYRAGMKKQRQRDFSASKLTAKEQRKKKVKARKENEKIT